MRGIRRVWGKAQYVAVKKWRSESVETELHGSPATINFANPYPYLIRLHPNYNAPQVELVATSADVLGRPVTVIDIGARSVTPHCCFWSVAARPFAPWNALKGNQHSRRCSGTI